MGLSWSLPLRNRAAAGDQLQAEAAVRRRELVIEQLDRQIDSRVPSALETVQTFGGYGFTTEYGVERILRDAVGSRLYSGTNEMQKNIIARWMGL